MSHIEKKYFFKKYFKGFFFFAVLFFNYVKTKQHGFKVSTIRQGTLWKSQLPSLFPAYIPLLFTSPKVTTGTDFSYSPIVPL